MSDDGAQISRKALGGLGKFAGYVIGAPIALLAVFSIPDILLTHFEAALVPTMCVEGSGVRWALVGSIALMLSPLAVPGSYLVLRGFVFRSTFVPTIAATGLLAGIAWFDIAAHLAQRNADMARGFDWSFYTGKRTDNPRDIAFRNSSFCRHVRMVFG